MRHTLGDKFFDSIILFFLVMSSGGMLFVFSRNIMYAVFLFVLLLMFILNLDKLSKSLVSATILTLFSLLLLFGINYVFATVNQSLAKYGYYIMVVVVSVLTAAHFKNQRTSEDFIKTLYFVLKLVVVHAFINVLMYGSLSIILGNSDFIA